MNNWDLLEERLRKHDYYYQHSDDFRCWSDGNTDEEEIRGMLGAFIAEDIGRVANLIMKHKRGEHGTNFMTEVN